MPKKIVVVSEGIRAGKLGRKIECHLKERFDIFYQSTLEVNVDADVVLFILIVDKMSNMSVNAVKAIYLRFRNIPILFISGQSDPKERIREKVEVIEKGADEYLSDSQTLEEIEASVKALTRRRLLKEYGDVVFAGKDFKVELNSRKIASNGKEVFLTKIEFDIVYYLALNVGRVITYKELYEAVWKREYLCDDMNIMAHIHRIRQKLEKDPKKPAYIQTVYGVGYCFTDSKKQNTIADAQYIEKKS